MSLCNLSSRHAKWEMENGKWEWVHKEGKWGGCAAYVKHTSLHTLPSLTHMQIRRMYRLCSPTSWPPSSSCVLPVNLLAVPFHFYGLPPSRFPLSPFSFLSMCLCPKCECVCVSAICYAVIWHQAGLAAFCVLYITIPLEMGA